jgi:hypothetical protein
MKTQTRANPRPRWPRKQHPGRSRGLAAFLVALGLSFPVGAETLERVRLGDPEPRNGFFDVSVEYAPDGTGWISYSRVTIPGRVDTRIARSRDQGKTWTYVTTPNTSFQSNDKINGKRPFWRYETSSLLYDPDDAPARRWKLFVEKYPSVAPHKPQHNLHHRGWVEFKTAPDPAGPWSAAVRLFGKKEDGARAVSTELHPDLKGAVFCNEIGSLTDQGIVYLSLDMSPTSTGLGRWEDRRVILVSSLDHGSTWRYVGTLTDHADAQRLGHRVLTGSALVKDKERFFLLATPAGALNPFSKIKGHNGVVVFEFDDLARGKLKRDGRGDLVVLRTLKPTLPHGGGLCDYDEQNQLGGLLFCQFHLKGKPEFFRLFQAGGPLNGERRPPPSERSR